MVHWHHWLLHRGVTEQAGYWLRSSRPTRAPAVPPRVLLPRATPQLVVTYHQYLQPIRGAPRLQLPLGIAVKAWVGTGNAPEWLAPYANQGVLNWAFCMICCTVVSLMTAPPRAEQVSDDLTFNWQKMNIGGQLGTGWKSVTLWWSLSVVMMIAFIIIFGWVL